MVTTTTSFRVLTDLKTLLSDVTVGLKAANITGISSQPYIYIKGKDSSPTLAQMASGAIQLIGSQRAVSKRIARYRFPRYLVDGITQYNDVTNNSDQTLNEIMTDLERVLDLNSNTPTKAWEFEFIDSIESLPYTKGHHKWRLEAILLLQLADGSDPV